MTAANISAVIGSPPPMRSDVEKVGQNMAIVAIGNIATPLIGIATQPILAMCLGVSGRGEVAAATAPLLFAMAIGPFGLPEALIYIIAKTGVVHKNSLLRAGVWTFISGLALTAGTVLIRNQLSGGHGNLSHYIVYSSFFIFPTLFLALVRGVASGLQAWRLVAVEQVVGAIFRLVFTASFAVAHRLTPLSASLIIAVSLVFGGISYIPLLRISRLDSSMRKQADTLGDFRMQRYALRVWLGYLGGIVLLRLDQLILTPLSNVRQLGYYVVAVSIAESLLVVCNAVRDVTFASNAAKQDDGRLGASARIASIITIFMAIAVCAICLFLIPIVFGDSFKGSVVPTMVLSLGVVIITPGSIAGAGLTARGLPGRRSTSLILAALVNVAALFVLVPAFGAAGAAWATVLGNGVFGTSNMVLLRRAGGPKVRSLLGVRAGDLALMRGIVFARAA